MTSGGLSRDALFPLSPPEPHHNDNLGPIQRSAASNSRGSVSCVSFPTSLGADIGCRWPGLLRRASFRRRRRSAASSTDLPPPRLIGLQTGIRVLTFNRPSAKNALSRRMLDEFADGIARIKEDEGARVLILRSLVAGVFCAGETYDASFRPRTNRLSWETGHV